MNPSEIRHDVWLHAKRMWEEGLVVASAGNVSRRADEKLIAITPTAVAYDVLTEDEIVLVELETGQAVGSIREPSYELPMHLAIYRSRPEVQAVVHTHAPYVTTLSVLRRPLPPVIDEMALYFGGTVDVTDYAFTGTDAVGTNVVRTLGDRAGVILANHGNVCIGRDLRQALHVALVMEACARVYVTALQVGEPVALPIEAVAAGRRMYEAKHKR
ncbi:MAG TPA: class II aldolase/adducin family protein [Thermoanaerobaculia bacterium]|nr:class II aldolase/adducin family protein [Thermoanaerobaculia bacterium]